MEAKNFKPFEKVIVRFRDGNWICDIYSHYNIKTNTHTTIGFCDLEDDCILPYEGNEHLVGTTDSPDEEVKLEEGEWILTSDFIDGMKMGCCSLGKFIRIEREDFVKDSYQSDGLPYNFAIKFSDFNPYDMEETSRHILCVKNGKIIRYKGN